MPKVSPLQDSFTSGEFSPLLKGRVSADRYKDALETCLNYLPLIQGPITRRTGTYYVAKTKDSSKKSRLQAFEFSTTQAYILEFGDEYVRFYKDNGIITLSPQAISGVTQANPAVVTYVGSDTYANGDRIIIDGVVGMTQLNNVEFTVANVNAGANTFELSGIDSTSYGAYSSGGTVSEIYEVAMPYQDTEVFDLKFTQSADILYITHPTYAPRKLTRTGHTSWTLTTIDFLDGPYLSTNTTTTTLSPSAASGTGVTLTASAITGINNDTGFQTTDVGRLIRIKEGSVWGYVKITGWTSTTVVTVDVINTLTNTTAKATWRLGVWSGTTGYPAAVTFHEDRLFFLGPSSYPQRLDGSRASDYENFAPTDTDGTVTSSHAVGFSLNANDVNVGKWLISDEKGLLVGTVGGEWVVRASSQNEALSPTNITAKRATSYGSNNVQPVAVGKSALFIQRSGRKLREMTYFFDVDGFRAADLTQLSEHVTRSGITQIAYQKEPQSIVWCVRTDGVLAAMTYERDLDALRAGWSRVIIGGTSDAGGSDAIVESVAVIPNPEGTRQDIWIIVKRYINGGTKRYVEYLGKMFEDDDEQKDAYFLDSGITYDAPLTITGATQANPVVITSASHGLSNGDEVRIYDVMGMEELNGNVYTLANVAANTFELSGINGTAFGAYISGGVARKLVSSLSGLNHLEGETIQVLADGAVLPDVEVTAGSVTISNPSAVIHFGYNKSADLKMLRIEAGAADGTALGKTRRIHRVGLQMHRSLGLKIGFDFDALDTITFRNSSVPLNQPPELFTGILSQNVPANYDFDNQICIRQDQPLPSTILSIMPQMLTYDR
ncbi:hypothetical protein E6Q11_02540 [Candidatus Dojkabacteria bacterium]|uniref:Ubiquitin-activating enzyme E1 FCCH domain-containing protein n=1 Tax=Candidatus Dojkabacteria bacterium TaxID=2099670 RepID=A0A5C7J849_9BACT|nr:MAG: hypothetical protein E6Q11_02540 [Candidatus Dojkabacteria bacterium]